MDHQVHTSCCLCTLIFVPSVLSFESSCVRTGECNGSRLYVWTVVSSMHFHETCVTASTAMMPH